MKVQVDSCWAQEAAVALAHLGCRCRWTRKFCLGPGKMAINSTGFHTFANAIANANERVPEAINWIWQLLAQRQQLNILNCCVLLHQAHDSATGSKTATANNVRLRAIKTPNRAHFHSTCNSSPVASAQSAREKEKKWIWKLRLSAKLDNKLQFYLQTATCSRATKLPLATTSNGRRPLPLCLACKLHCLLVDASCNLQLANRASITHTICRGNGNPITTTTTMEPDFCCFRARSKQLATKATQIVNGHVAKSRKIA